MPIIQSAKKKVRKDKTRTKVNQNYKSKIELLSRRLKQADGKKKQELNRQLSSVIDRAAKKRVVAKKKASRMKSKFAKLVSSKIKSSS